MSKARVAAVKYLVMRGATMVACAILWGAVLAGYSAADQEGGKAGEETGKRSLFQLREAAQTGDVQAQCELGVMYYEGTDVSKDLAEAVKWFTMAADQGNAEAQCWCGRICYDGWSGVRRNYIEAAKWFRKAALQGYPLAQMKLGMMYGAGQGVERSSLVAIDWLYKAGVGFMKEGDKENALVCLERMIKLNDEHPLTLKLTENIYGPTPGDKKKPEDGTEEQRFSSGTGWPVSAGLVVTNYHVVYGAKAIVVRKADGTEMPATLITGDLHNDLALLKVEDVRFLPPALPLAENPAKTGQSVFTIGYPQPHILGSEAKLTDGVVNAESGFQGDVTHLQISVPIQRGNSGGPLLNMNGEAVGIVVSKIDAIAFYGAAGGDMIENVNYAIKVAYLKVLLSAVQQSGTPVETLPGEQAPLADLAERTKPSILRVIARL